MKVFLCSPPTGYFIRDDRCQIDVRSRIAENIREPIQLLYLGGLLQKHKHEIFLRDYSLPRLSVQDVIADCTKFQPDVICIETTQGTFVNDVAFIKTLARHHPKGLFIVKAPFLDDAMLVDYARTDETPEHCTLFYIVRDFEHTTLTVLSNPNTLTPINDAYIVTQKNVINPKKVSPNDADFNINDYPTPTFNP